MTIVIESQPAMVEGSGMKFEVETFHAGHCRFSKPAEAALAVQRRGSRCRLEIRRKKMKLVNFPSVGLRDEMQFDSLPN